MGKFKIYCIFILSIYFIISCSNPQSEDKDKNIGVKDISVNKVSNRSPVENSDQVDLELLAYSREDDLNNDIDYKWYVEYLKLDIENDSKTEDNFKIEQVEDKLTINKYLEGYYFLDVSKSNPLNALLSIYKIGFYKITVKSENSSNAFEYSVIVKVGEPVLPNLFVKVNIPKIQKLTNQDFTGKFYLSILNNDLSNNSEIIELKAEQMRDEWFDTGKTINPLESFKIVAGTHILNDNLKTISSIIGNSNSSDADSMEYFSNNEEVKSISTTPIIIKGNNYNNLTIKKSGTKSWLKGNIYISCLTWKDDNSEYDKFICFEKLLNESDSKVLINLDNIYLSKIFIGSFGHKFPFNNYYIYFGPEGTSLDELDPKNERDFPALPYGYLLGRLGKDGKIFPISNNFNFENKQNIKVLSF